MTDKRKKVNKSVSLNADVYDRLLVVCELLGVNVNAYLVSAVGQQLQRDEAPVRAEKRVIEAMIPALVGHLNSEEFAEQSDEAALKIAEKFKEDIKENPSQ